MLLLAIIAVFVWWFVAMQNSSQTPEPVLNPTPSEQTPSTQNQTQNLNSQPSETQPSGGQTPGADNSTTLTTGNTNNDISKDLTNVDTQMNSLNADVTDSSQTVTPITGQ